MKKVYLSLLGIWGEVDVGWQGLMEAQVSSLGFVAFQDSLQVERSLDTGKLGALGHMIVAV